MLQKKKKKRENVPVTCSVLCSKRCEKQVQELIAYPECLLSSSYRFYYSLLCLRKECWSAELCVIFQLQSGPLFNKPNSSWRARQTCRTGHKLSRTDHQWCPLKTKSKIVGLKENYSSLLWVFFSFHLNIWPNVPITLGKLKVLCDNPNCRTWVVHHDEGKMTYIAFQSPSLSLSCWPFSRALLFPGLCLSLFSKFL